MGRRHAPDARAAPPPCPRVGRLIEKSKRVVVYTDFRDELGEAAEVQLAGVVVANNFERFRAKARVYLRAHEDHVAIQKLRRNRQLTPGDLGELERLLLEAGIADQQNLDRASQEASGLGLFVRSLVGLDREAATAAFEDFLAGKTLSANQLHFVNLVIAGLTESGVLEPGRLYESPFTDVAPQGPDTMFPADVEALFSILVEVKAHAVPMPRWARRPDVAFLQHRVDGGRQPAGLARQRDVTPKGRA